MQGYGNPGLQSTLCTMSHTDDVLQGKLTQSAVSFVALFTRDKGRRLRATADKLRELAVTLCACPKSRTGRKLPSLCVAVGGVVLGAGVGALTGTMCGAWGRVVAAACDNSFTDATAFENIFTVFGSVMGGAAGGLAIGAVGGAIGAALGLATVAILVVAAPINLWAEAAEASHIESKEIRIVQEFQETIDPLVKELEAVKTICDSFHDPGATVQAIARRSRNALAAVDGMKRTFAESTAGSTKHEDTLAAARFESSARQYTQTIEELEKLREELGNFLASIESQV